MTIFAILMPAPQPTLAEAIKAAYSNDHLCVTETQWLVSSNETVIDVTTKIGVYDPKDPNKPATGNAIVMSMGSYYGRAPSIVWDWVKSKLEPASHG